MLAAITARFHGQETYLQKLYPLFWTQKLAAGLLVATINLGVLGVERHFDDPVCSSVK